MWPIISRCADFLRRAVSQRRRPRADREIAIVGPSELDCRSVIDLLRSGGRTGVPARPSEHAGEAPPGPDVYQVVYLPVEGSRRNRWWNVHVPQWDLTRKGPVEGPWQVECDTILLCLPYRDILEGGVQEDCLKFCLPFSVAYARRRGRLRRTAIVLTGMPANLSPRHASQVVLEIRDGIDLRQAILTQIAAASGRAGDGLADPDWVRFLKEEIASNHTLAEFLDVIRRAAGRPCPVLFINEESPSVGAEGPLGTWIEGRRSRVRTRGLRLSTTAAVLAALLFAVTAGLAWSLPSRLSSDEIGRLSCGPAKGLEPQLKRAILDYSRNPVRLVGMGLQLGGATDNLRRALLTVEVQAHREYLLDILDVQTKSCRKTIEGVFTLLGATEDPNRLEMVDRIGDFIQGQIGVHRDWVLESVKTGFAPTTWKPWDDCLSQSGALAALLSLERRGEGLAQIAPDPDVAALALKFVDGLGRQAEADRLRPLFTMSVPKDFYRFYQDLQDQFNASGNDILVRFARYVPRGEPFMDIEGTVTVDPTKSGPAILLVDRVFALLGGQVVERHEAPQVSCPSSGYPRPKIAIGPGERLDLTWKVTDDASRRFFREGRGGTASLSIPPQGWTRQCGDSIVRLYGLVVDSRSGTSPILNLKGESTRVPFRRGKPALPPDRVRIRLSWTRDSAGPGRSEAVAAAQSPTGTITAPDGRTER
jgi:hypothetical protein